MHQDKITLHLSRDAMKLMTCKKDDSFILRQVQKPEAEFCKIFKDKLNDDVRLFIITFNKTYRVLGFDTNGKCLHSAPSHALSDATVLKGAIAAGYKS